MEFDQKIRIIKRFLEEKIFKGQLKDGDLASYSDLHNLLDYIALRNDGLFDLKTLESDPDQWREFCGILIYATTFENSITPPFLKDIDFQKVEEGIRYTLNAHEIIQLPKDDYYKRSTHYPQNIDNELDDLIQRSRTLLYQLAQTFPDATSFDASSSLQIAAVIQSLEEEKANVIHDTQEREKVERKLNVLFDLNKINELRRISIPQDNGTNLNYCILQENVGGVTEKISLIQLETVKKQLRNLCGKAEELSIENYHTNRKDYRLSTEAIIKLPKHGNIKEVQHEAMALNISRLMKFDTAASTTISHNGHPALFVPFEEIRLLSEFSLGKTFYAWLLGKTYTHYSTVKAVGEGIQPDCFIDDFGHILGLLYLCSDTDAVGGNCQNKALRNAKSLFVFDQSLMDTNKFILDSRLCLIPGEFFKKHTRHGLGRNRTIIEDSSIERKFESIIQLRARGDKILQYITHVAWQHHQQAKRIKRQFKKPLSTEKQSQLTSELSDLMVLEKDAEILQAKVLERLEAIEDVLPQAIGDIDTQDIRQALIFEKLLHNPILYSDDGRPFKYPWTHRQNNKIKTIEALSPGMVQLTFTDKISLVMLDFIKRHGGGDSITATSAKTITLSKEHFAALRDNLLHPEFQLVLNDAIDYLDPTDLEILKEAYSMGYRTSILETIKNYRKKMHCDKSSIEDKLNCIIHTEEQIREFILRAHDQGFGMHVLKKFFFDAQQQLQNIIPTLSRPIKLNDAFSAALKLDRISEFNSVVLEAIKQNKVADQKFINFLEECIHRANAATNYVEAQEESRTLSNSAKQVIQQLHSLPIPCSEFLRSSLQQKSDQNEKVIHEKQTEKGDEDWVVKGSPPLMLLDMVQEEQTGMSCKC